MEFYLLHQCTQSVGATGGVHKGQGHIQLGSLGQTYKTFLVEGQIFADPTTETIPQCSTTVLGDNNIREAKWFKMSVFDYTREKFSICRRNSLKRSDHFCPSLYSTLDIVITRRSIVSVSVVLHYCC